MSGAGSQLLVLWGNPLNLPSLSVCPHGKCFPNACRVWFGHKYIRLFCISTRTQWGKVFWCRGGDQWKLWGNVEEGGELSPALGKLQAKEEVGMNSHYKYNIDNWEYDHSGYHWNIMERSTKLCNHEPWAYHLPATWPWVSLLTSLRFSFHEPFVLLSGPWQGPKHCSDVKSDCSMTCHWSTVTIYVLT